MDQPPKQEKKTNFLKAWLASEDAQRDSVLLRKIYIDINDGSVHAGILFSQIMYWHGTNTETGKPRLTIYRDGHYWLAKRYNEWYLECRINEFTAKAEIGKMIRRGLLVKALYKFGGLPTVHIRINPDEFERRIEFIRDGISNGIDILYLTGSLRDTQPLTETPFIDPFIDSDQKGNGGKNPPPPKTKQSKRAAAGIPEPAEGVLDAICKFLYGDLDGWKLNAWRIQNVYNEIAGKFAPPTIENLRAAYAWWFVEDFRGQNDSNPEPAQLIEKWSIAIKYDYKAAIKKGALRKHGKQADEFMGKQSGNGSQWGFKGATPRTKLP